MGRAKWTAGDVEAGGVRLRIHRTGGDKPALVLAHGITDLGLVWTLVARILESTHDVVMVDARGHGGSDTPDHGYLPTDHAADLAGVIEALNLGQARVMGHSMGAAAATVLAATRPDLVSRLILEDPSWRDAPAVDTAALEEVRDAEIADRRRQLAVQKSLGRDALIESARVDYPTWDESELEPWADGKVQVRPEVFEFFFDPHGGWRDLVPRIACPTLLVTGDVSAGAIVTEEQAGEVTSLNPRFEVAHIPGASHSIRRTRFEPFMKAVSAFLR